MHELTDNEAQTRFELIVDGEVAAIARYVLRGGRRYFVHTEVDPRFEGQGLASELARGVLERSRERDELIVPLCPFIAGYIDRHPEYGDLVDQPLYQAMSRPR
ncbi:MAG: N-acetyltransferase [Ilumatobacteraceae bacterium]|nr:N-acetyltransferase [Ilumatobacteraceae bacterium]